MLLRRGLAPKPSRVWLTKGMRPLLPRTTIRVQTGIGGPYIRVEDANREVLLTSEMYSTANAARRAARALKRRMPLAKIVDETRR